MLYKNLIKLIFNFSNNIFKNNKIYYICECCKKCEEYKNIAIYNINNINNINNIKIISKINKYILQCSINCIKINSNCKIDINENNYNNIYDCNIKYLSYGCLNYINIQINKYILYYKNGPCGDIDYIENFEKGNIRQIIYYNSCSPHYNINKSIYFRSGKFLSIDYFKNHCDIDKIEYLTTTNTKYSRIEQKYYK